ncbi:striatin-interacting proteins 2-like [Hydractinia symbiolongicarpus]|uniref:striatin-interacting proteins 2-like n=1 Tax=Hydractinia symbiolongicarpus TaxID=13093 RepID=UPI002550BC19|nr:striatin-interacting proteins 2-like [Hydractinia symbiolongicarpus]
MADDLTVKSSTTNEENNDSIPPPSPEKPPQEEGRRSVPRLREIMRRQRKDSDTQPDAPLLNFQYNDTDSLQDELSELYSYTEEDEFKENASAFQTSFTEYMKNETVLWCDMELVQKRGFIFYVLEKLEVVDIEERRIASRTLLYLAQGMYRDQEDFNECTAMMKENAMILYKCGVYSCVQQLLVMEAENPEAVQLAMQKPSISIADSIDLRIYLNILYMMTEIIRNFEKSDDILQATAESLREELAGCVDINDGQPFACILFDLVLKFCAGSSPHYPIKKILLLLWKVILFTLGGFKELQVKMKEARVQAGLTPSFGEQHANTIETEKHHQLRPSSPSEESIQRLKPRKTVDLDDDDIDFVPAPITQSHHYVENVLLLRPKVREKDVGSFLGMCRSKYIGYQLLDDNTSTAGLPPSIKEGLNVLRSHVYTSLSEVQIKQEEEHADRPFSKGIHELPETNSEVLYKSLLPNLPQYMIALLKMLLASAPTAKAKTESINILTDVLPPEMPTTVLQSMQLGIDVNRHKEIMVKSISALILLLLKHLKVNHIYQFEFVSQHLVFANCIPLVLKFFNQNISAYVAAKNSIPQLDFPTCVLEERSEITAESLEAAENASYFCWRNLFSCINLLRILQKLTKWKYSRTMMLVVFKSAPILKRALKIREENLQMYVLKLLKTQIKYLGRNWRKSNMRIMSLIYHKIRHRLNDDWAFANDVDARPWDFQTEECAIRHNVDLFNYHHYESNGTHYPSDLQPVDNDLHSVLSQKIRFSEQFLKDSSKWLDREVFNTNVDWDELIDENYLDES